MIRTGGREEVGLIEYALVLGIGAFVVLKVLFIAPRFSDGNAYLYMAQLVAGGAIPYRDFFFASPPLIPYMFAAVGGLFGFSWRVFSFLPVVFSVADAVIIFWLVKNKFTRLAGVVAALLYLFSFAVLATSDFYSGVHLALTLALLGMLAALRPRSRPLLSGILFGLAALTKLYLVVLYAAVLVLWLLKARWSQAGKSLLGFGVMFGLVALVFWWLAGSAFFDMVVFNHLSKSVGIPKERLTWFFVRHDTLLLLGVMSIFVSRRWVPAFIVVPILLVAGYFVMFQDVYYLHLKMLVVWLALLWGWAVWQVQQRWSQSWAVGLAVALIVSAAGMSTWLYVEEQARVAVITDLESVVASVERLTDSGEAIYGDYSITPLLALVSDRPVFNNYIDVNPMYFQTGVFDLEQRAQELAAAGVRIIVTKNVVGPGGRVLSGHEKVLPASFFADYCRPARVFEIERDYEDNAVVIWQCDY